MQTRWHYSDSDTAWLAEALAYVGRAERAALAARGEFHIVLAGGNTPRKVYEALAREAHDWPRWRVWFGDERCLPADHPERNSVMARAVLERIGALPPPFSKGGRRDLPTSAVGTGINPPQPPFEKAVLPLPGDATENARWSGLPLFQRGNEGDLAAFACAAVSEIPPNPPLKKGGTIAPTASPVNGNSAFGKGGSGQVHTIPAELGARAAAQAYAAELAGVGEFDLVILGLGEDGHTASLFPCHISCHTPGYVAKPEADALAVFDAPKPPPERVSLSAGRLSRARHVLFLVSGLGKRDALRRWRAGAPLIPAATIQPEAGVDVLLAPDLSTPGVFP